MFFMHTEIQGYIMNTQINSEQKARLEEAMVRNGGSIIDIEWLCTHDNFKIVMFMNSQGINSSMLKVNNTVPINSLVNVDRNEEGNIPVGTMGVCASRYQGPESYNLLKVGHSLHQRQRDNIPITGTEVFNELAHGGPIELCLSLADGLAIAKKGIEVFRACFGHKDLILWKGVVQNCGYKNEIVPRKSVPILCGDSDWVAVRWQDLRDNLTSNQYTAFYPKV